MSSTGAAVRTSRRPALSQQRVFEAGVALADRIGVDDLTIRRLADDLGVSPMTIYHHVPSKDEILDGIEAFVVDEARRGGMTAQARARFEKTLRGFQDRRDAHTAGGTDGDEPPA